MSGTDRGVGDGPGTGGAAGSGYAAGVDDAAGDSLAVDVLVVSLGATGGLRAADAELCESMRRAGARVVLATAARPREVRTFALTDLAWAISARRAAAQAIARHRPRAIVYSSVTAALLWPRPGAIRFDSLAARNRPGRHGVWQRRLERARLAAAPLLVPCAEGSLDGVPAAALRVGKEIVLPIPVEPSAGPASAGPSIGPPTSEPFAGSASAGPSGPPTGGPFAGPASARPSIGPPTSEPFAGSASAGPSGPPTGGPFAGPASARPSIGPPTGGPFAGPAAGGLPTGSPAGESSRDIAAITYAANPAKKGLDRVLAAWQRVRRPGEQLIVAGAPERELRRAGIELPGEGAVLTGMLSPAEYRGLLRRARVFVCAPRWEDYGIAQLEALADGCMLVTTPARGPYAALPLAKRLDTRLVAEDLGPALRAALDSPRADYRRRAREMLEPWRREAVDGLVADRLLPRLLG